MVKDILREIKHKWFQFFAIVVITMLGVGFFIGIQVTGYDMRQTADHYMEESKVLDLEIHHSLGIDQEMIDEISKDLDAFVYGVYDADSYVSNKDFDTVVKIFECSDNIKNDLRLIEGKLPQNKQEAALDSVMKELYEVKIGDELTIHKGDVFKEQKVKVVAFVESALYMNLERGQTRLGSGGVSGFIYASNLDKKIDVYTSARIILKDENKLEESKKILEEKEISISDNRFDRVVAPDIKKLEDAQSELDEKTLEVNQEFRDAQSKLDKSKITLQDSFEEIESGLLEINGSLSGSDLMEEWETAQRVLSEKEIKAKEEIKGAYLQAEQVEDPQMKEAMLAQIKENEIEMEAEFAAAYKGLKTLKEGISQYEEGLKEYNDAYAKVQREKTSAYSKLKGAQKKIDDGYKKIHELEHGKIYIQEREDVLIGYREFYQDSDRIEAIGQVFPLIFFGVAVLVTLSTVSRMIDESRMQIGVYKALGYSSMKSALKFVGFTGIAWFIGSILGLAIGFYMIPKLIYNAYRIMYKTPELIDGIVLSYAWMPLLISFASSVGVALIKSLSVSREKTASLLRPPMPKGGQRILLERMGFFWNRLSFLYKVSLRNLFRNKTRFLMTIVGIGGSFGLLITGFGLKHSIYSIVDKQFDEIVQYDGMVVYEEGSDIDTSLFSDSIDLSSKTVKVKNNDVLLYVVDDMKELSQFVHFKDRESKEDLDIKEDEVIISEKLALLNKIEVGDTISYTHNEKVYETEVGQISENYVFHYIYMPKSVHEKISSKEVQNNMNLFRSKESDEHINKTLYENDEVLAINHLVDMRETYRDMMGNFDIVIVVIVGAAFALELIVLLNLITMNLSERYKEMATLKVLGFYPKELALYLLRENIILTFISLLFGFVFGKYLHQFVIINAEIDAIMFNRELLASSYILGAVLTLGLSIIINVLMAKKANKVNMSEALKTFDA